MPLFCFINSNFMIINKQWKRLLTFSVIVGAIVGSWAVWYVFFKPHRNVGTETAAYSMTSAALSTTMKNDTAAFAKYIDKALLVEGPISTIDGNHVSMENIICNIDSTDLPKIAALKIGTVVKIQGRLTTYNDLMEEIMMDQCVIKDK